MTNEQQSDRQRYGCARRGRGSSSEAGSVGLGFAVPVDTLEADPAKPRAGEADGRAAVPPPPRGSMRR